MPNSNRPNTKLKNNPFIAPSYWYPDDLGSVGEEPYTLIQIKESVVDGQVLGSVALPIPKQLQTTYGTQYETEEMDLRQFLSRFTHDAKNGFGFNDGTRQSAEIGLGVVSGVTQTEVLKAYRDSEKYALNPHMAQLFKNVNFRSFSFAFDFMARSVSESDMIRNIIWQLKYHMHPSLGNANLSLRGNRWWNYPNNFDISFFTPAKPEDFLFKISTCALTNMVVDYGGSQVPAFFTRTGAPVHINVSLQFQEMEVMTRERIQEQY